MGRLHEILTGVEEVLKGSDQRVRHRRRKDRCGQTVIILMSVFMFVNSTSMASKPQYSLASSSRGTSACSKRVVPHVFKMKRLLETNMLLSLEEGGKKKTTFLRSRIRLPMLQHMH